MYINSGFLEPSSKHPMGSMIDVNDHYIPNINVYLDKSVRHFSLVIHAKRIGSIPNKLVLVNVASMRLKPIIEGLRCMS